MESTATAEPVRSGPCLTNLPRETRNQIYSYLLVSSKPIKVCHQRYNLDSSWLYLRAGRQNKAVSIEFLCYAVEGSELAQEAYEEFFRNNTFDCGSCENLRRFLTTIITRFDFQNNLVPNATNHGCLKFEKNPWIRKVKTSMFFDDFSRKSSEHLAHLLSCPHLQHVEITIFGLTGEYSELSSVDWTIEAIARVCKRIRGKVGDGLVVKVQKDWGGPRPAQWIWSLMMPAMVHAMISNSELDNVNWMWEEPSDEARGKVRKGLGTHKEKIQVLTSAGWAEQKGKLGAWAEHWRQEHTEQQRLRELQILTAS